jgi:hypothetical protein
MAIDFKALMNKTPEERAADAERSRQEFHTQMNARIAKHKAELEHIAIAMKAEGSAFGQWDHKFVGDLIRKVEQRDISGYEGGALMDLSASQITQIHRLTVIADQLIGPAASAEASTLEQVAASASTEIKPLSRQDEIQEALARLGLRMEHSLSVLDGAGHAVMNIATGEQVDDADLSPEVIALAEEWTVLEGPVVDQEDDAIADRIANRVLPAVPDLAIFRVWHDGDSSVGLPGDRCTVEIDLRSYAQADRRDYIEQVRDTLKASFGAMWDTQPKVMTSDEIRAEEAWLDGGSKVWRAGDTAKFGKNSEREVPVFAGLFRYSGLGMGNYYSAENLVEWTDTTDAQRRAKAEAVPFVYWDAESAFDPVGYEGQTGDKRISMSERNFQWWQQQQAAWHKVVSALHEHWSSRVMDRGVDGVVDAIKTIANEANAYREAGHPGPAAAPVVEPDGAALQWFAPDVKPPEQRNLVVILDSGVPILGRNILGRFAQYDSVNDRFVDWMEGHENGFHGIKCWAEVVAPDQPASELNSRILLAEAARYLDLASSKRVDVEWLLASIQRHLDGKTIGERPGGPAVAIADADRHLSGAGLPSYTRVVSALADAKPYVEASVRGNHIHEYPRSYAYNLSRLTSVEHVLNQYRAVQKVPAVATVPMQESERTLARAIAQVGTEPSPNTINIQAYGPDGKMVSVGSRSSSDVRRDLRIMEGAVELVHAIGRGVDINPTKLYSHLVGDGVRHKDGSPVRGFVLAFPGASKAEGDELIETLRRGGNAVYRVDDDSAASVLREVAESAGLEAGDLQP